MNDDYYDTELCEPATKRPMRKRQAMRLASGLAAIVVRESLSLDVITRVLDIDERDARLVQLQAEVIADRLERRQKREWLAFRDGEPDRTLRAA